CVAGITSSHAASSALAAVPGSPRRSGRGASRTRRTRPSATAGATRMPSTPSAPGRGGTRCRS
ncbi:MAG: hypothetical protein AVDCRST_MAG77-4104, partial [uncultured Chloroflexi bacterium]